MTDTDPMPVFTIKAKDKLAIRAVEAYRLLCLELGLDVQADEVDKALTEIVAWREAHPDQVKLPDHPHIPVTGTEATR